MICKARMMIEKPACLNFVLRDQGFVVVPVGVDDPIVKRVGETTKRCYPGSVPPMLPGNFNCWDMPEKCEWREVCGENVSRCWPPTSLDRSVLVSARVDWNVGAAPREFDFSTRKSTCWQLFQSEHAQGICKNDKLPKTNIAREK